VSAPSRTRISRTCRSDRGEPRKGSARLTSVSGSSGPVPAASSRLRTASRASPSGALSTTAWSRRAQTTASRTVGIIRRSLISPSRRAMSQPPSSVCSTSRARSAVSGELNRARRAMISSSAVGGFSAMRRAWPSGARSGSPLVPPRAATITRTWSSSGRLGAVRVRIAYASRARVPSSGWSNPSISRLTRRPGCRHRCNGRTTVSSKESIRARASSVRSAATCSAASRNPVSRLLSWTTSWSLTVCMVLAWSRKAAAST